jgi:hypothetical protein
MRVRSAAAAVAGMMMFGCFSLSAQEIDLTSLKCKEFIRTCQQHHAVARRLSSENTKIVTWEE